MDHCCHCVNIVPAVSTNNKHFFFSKTSKLSKAKLEPFYRWDTFFGTSWDYGMAIILLVMFLFVDVVEDDDVD